MMERDFEAKLKLQHQNQPTPPPAESPVQRSASITFRAPQELFSINDFELGKIYGVGSYSKDTQLLLWDLAMDEIAVPLRCPPGGSPTLSAGSPLAHWDNLSPVGTLQPAPSMRDVAKLSPVVAHRVHAKPLSGLSGSDNSQSSSSETALGTTTSKDRSIFPSVEGGGLSYRQPPPILLRD